MRHGLRVAAIDCGTNSVRLLIADLAGGGLTDVHRETRIVRLGEGVDRTGVLAPAAIERTRAALADYAATIADAGAGRVRMVATSATRDAANRDEFAAAVRAVLGVDPEVITGDQEAALSFAGAVGSLPAITGPVLLADIGGGSTELVAGSFGTTDPLRARSTDVGSVRLTERHVRTDPPSTDEVAAVAADVEAALRRAGRDVPLREADTLVGVAGTVTTLAAVALGLTEYRAEVVHGAELRAAEVEAVTARVLAMPRAERAATPAIHPGRVDVIAAGAVILRTIVRVAGVQRLVVSEHDILDGIALSLR